MTGDIGDPLPEHVPPQLANAARDMLSHLFG